MNGVSLLRRRQSRHRPSASSAGGRLRSAAAAAVKSPGRGVRRSALHSDHESSISDFAALRQRLAEAGLLITLSLAAFSIPGSALADTLADDVIYDPSLQNETLTNVAGALYLALVAYFFWRVFTKRAKRFASQRVGEKQEAPAADADGTAAADSANAADGTAASANSAAASNGTAAAAAETDPELQEPVIVTPFATLFGAAQAFAFAVGIFYLAANLDTYFANTAVPDGYTASNLSLAFRTIVRGLVYLAAFIFGANGVGLLALSVKLIIYGDDDAPPRRKKEAAKKQVGLTSDLADVARAFDAAQDIERARKSRKSQGEGS